MTTNKIRVGIVGANPERGWGTTAHIPALIALDDFEVTAVATTKPETAAQTAARFNIPHSFGNWRELVVHPEVDVVAVCVKVAFHREIVLAALAAGKHVFCEWPLGLNSAEAEEMLAAARRAGTRHAIGLQGRGSPMLNYIRDLVATGEIGEVISVTLVSSLSQSGAKMLASEAYRADVRSGATALTVPGGHSLDSLAYCLGEFSELSAIVTTRHSETTIVGTNEVIEVTSPDQILVTGRLIGGAVASVHIKADIYRPTGVLLQINGRHGDIVVSTRPPVGRAPVGIQRAGLVLSIARNRGDYEELTLPDYNNRAPMDLVPGPSFYTAQLYARFAESIRKGTSMSPDFQDAVRRHHMLDAVQRASDTGIKQQIADLAP